MDAQGAVHTRTVDAQENPVRDAGPAGVLGAAIKAGLGAGSDVRLVRAPGSGPGRRLTPRGNGASLPRSLPQASRKQRNPRPGRY